MMHFRATLVALIGTIRVNVCAAPYLVRDSARLDKPILQPALPDLSAGFIANLDSGSFDKIELWTNGLINEDCTKWMKDMGIVNLKNDVEMYNVTFNDAGATLL
jgi:hypothetical protein